MCVIVITIVFKYFNIPLYRMSLLVNHFFDVACKQVVIN